MKPIYLLLTLCTGTAPGENTFIIVVEWPSWKVVEAYERKHVLFEKSHKGFSGASLKENELTVTTEGEILQFSLAPLKIKKTITQTFLNDVHHLASTAEGYVIVNTGLDCLEFFDHDLSHKSSLSVIPFFRPNFSYLKRLAIHSIKKERIRRQKSYLYGHLGQRVLGPNIRKYLSPLGLRRQNGRDLRYYDLRPHFLHPNHITVHGEKEYWVTLYFPGVVLQIPDGRVLATGLGRPHDGVVHNGEFFVTDCMGSRIIIFEMNGGYPGKKRLDKEVIPAEGKGLLRGLAVVEDTVFAGLTALRDSLKCRDGRVMVLDRISGDIKEIWQIPNKFGTSIYSILDVTTCYSNLS